MKNKNNTKLDFYPSALTVSGSDSCGGAGIQADLRTFNAYAVYGCSAVTAVTAQNIKKIAEVCPMSAQTVANQIDSVLDSVPVRFAKSGMLCNKDIIRTVAASVKKYSLKLVADIVMFSESGTCLLEKDSVQIFADELMPLCYAVILNTKEAEIFSGMKIKNIDDLCAVAKKLSGHFKNICVIKSSFTEKNKYAIDACAYDGHVYQLRSTLLKNCRHTHGMDCTLSAAFCANLALGAEWDDALIEAKTFVFGSLAEPVRLGDDTEVMYPPETDYSEHICLLEV